MFWRSAGARCATAHFIAAGWSTLSGFRFLTLHPPITYSQLSRRVNAEDRILGYCKITISLTDARGALHRVTTYAGRAGERRFERDFVALVDFLKLVGGIAARLKSCPDASCSNLCIFWRAENRALKINKRGPGGPRYSRPGGRRYSFMEAHATAGREAGATIYG
jgi:hypothetical protein